MNTTTRDVIVTLIIAAATVGGLGIIVPSCQERQEQHNEINLQRFEECINAGGTQVNYGRACVFGGGDLK